MWRNSCSSCLGIDRLDAQQHKGCIADSADGNIGIHAHVFLKIAALDKQAIAPDCIDVSGATDKRDGDARTREDCSEITTDGACTDDCDPLWLHDISIIRRIKRDRSPYMVSACDTSLDGRTVLPHQPRSATEATTFATVSTPPFPDSLEERLFQSTAAPGHR